MSSPLERGHVKRKSLRNQLFIDTAVVDAPKLNTWSSIQNIAPKEISETQVTNYMRY